MTTEHAKIPIMTMISVKKFCSEGTSLQGQIPLAEMLRLTAEETTKTSGFVHYALQGGIDEDARPYIRGEISAELSHRCQRCLENMVLPIKTEFHWSPVQHESEADGLPEPYVPILLSETGEAALMTLLEDEILLSLPLIPSHSEAVCNLPESVNIGSDAPEPIEVEKNNPFAMLANLKNKVQ